MGGGNKDTFSLGTFALTQFAMNAICFLLYLNIGSCERQVEHRIGFYRLA